MDQIKIGKFIASCRKEEGMTQAELAEKLGISDRAVSKWETGKSMPDSGIMLELCGFLKINVNELLSGERIMAEFYSKQVEENLLAMRREVEERDRRALKLEYWMGFSAVLSGSVLILLASFLEMPFWLRMVLSAFCPHDDFTGQLLSRLALNRKQDSMNARAVIIAMYPLTSKVILSMHKGRARYMKCAESFLLY